MKLNFMLRKSILAGIAAMLMGVSLVFTLSASAHNIDLEKAWEQTRNYARLVRKESGGKYLHYATNCVEAFPNHNHIVRCVITYQNERDTAAGVYTCKETIEVYMASHNRSNNSNEDYTLLARHTSNNSCGSRRLEKMSWDFFSKL
jgi:3'-phosphoadenosine 5'-phosphosulfate (PAPS) 3'-phosphatase